MGFFATAGAALAVDNGASWFAAALLARCRRLRAAPCATSWPRELIK
jgi:hypothetical protein